MPFKPGVSGNPKGKAGPKRFHDALERAMVQDDGKRLRKAVESLLDLAAEGVPWAIQFLCERLDGKATQTIQVLKNERELSDGELANIAAGGGDGTAETQDGAEISPRVH